MTIHIAGSVRRGELFLTLDLHIPAGVTMISGPNGAGKTSLLRLVAGLEALDSGRVRFGDDVIDEPAVGRFVPAHHRPVAMAFQDHRLFPHLNVIDNVAFPLRRRGMGRDAARAGARPHLEAMGLAAHLTSRPNHLSVGQRQRCALARALATPADILLLDEPLAAIDEPSRSALRHHLRCASHGTTLWVTHSPDDADPDAGLISMDGAGVRQTREQ